MRSAYNTVYYFHCVGDIDEIKSIKMPNYGLRGANTSSSINDEAPCPCLYKHNSKKKNTSQYCYS